MSERTPTRVGQYEILRRLARGGMGEIFLARQIGIAGFERLAIVKTMISESAEAGHSVDQFFDEARLAANLNHPNVVSIFELGRFEQRYFIAMEYIHGIDLAGLSRAAHEHDAAIPPRVGAAILRSAALGLDYAHSAVDVSGRPMRIVHRDVSPQNLMVRLDGGVKVVDFGIAHATNRFAKTEHQGIKGKLLYLSPEQVRGLALSSASDQFSLGSVAWGLFAGRPLFKGDNPGETMYRIVASPVPSLCDEQPGFPEPLDAIVQRMLRRTPGERYPDCGAVARALQGYLDGSGGNADHEVADFVREHAGSAIAARLAVPEAGDGGAAATVVQRQGPTEPLTGAGRDGQETTLVTCAACLHSQSPHNLRCEDCGALLIEDAAARDPDEGQVSAVFSSLPSLSLEMIRSSVSQRLPAAAAADDPWDVPKTEVDGVLRGGGGARWIEFGEPVESVVLELAGQPRGRAAAATETTLVGREDVLAQVQAVLERAHGGEACGVLLLGQGGMGKTRLAHEAARLATERGFLACHAVALRRGVPLALDLFRQWVLGAAQALAERPRDVLTSTVAEALAALPAGLLRPTLVQRLVQLLDAQGGEASVDPVSHGQRMTTSMVCFLERVVERRPLLLVADDLHDVDEASLLLLRSVLRRLPRARLAVLATAIPGIADVVAGALTRIELGPLPPAQALALMVQHIALADGPPDLEGAVARAAGNPGVITAQARALLLEGYVGARSRRAAQAIQASHVLASVEGCARWATQRLRGPALEILQAAALSGMVFSARSLGALVGDSDAVQAALVDGESLGLIRPAAEDGDAFAFAQSSWRQSLLGSLEGEARARLRGALVRVQQGPGGALSREGLELVAQHLAAVAPDPPALAVRARAALVLLHQGLPLAAVSQLGAILEQVSRGLSSTRLATGDTCTALLGVAALLGSIEQHRDPERCGVELQRVLDLCAPDQALRERATALWRLCQCRRLAHRLPDATDALQRALRLARVLEDALLQATFEVEHAQVLQAAGESRSAIFVLAAALGRLGQIPVVTGETVAARQLQLASVYRQLARLYHQLDSGALALEAAQRAQGLAREARQLHDQVAASLTLADVDADRGRSLAVLGEAWQTVQGADDPWLAAELLVARGRLLQTTDPRASAELFVQAREAARLGDRRDIFAARPGSGPAGVQGLAPVP